MVPCPRAAWCYHLGMLELDTIKEAVAEVAKENGAHLALLFGSFARGTATAHSDVDVIFVEDTELPFLARLGRYFDPLVDRLRASVEVLVYTSEEFAGMADGPFVKQALAEGVVVYESGKVQSGLGALAGTGTR